MAPSLSQGTNPFETDSAYAASADGRQQSGDIAVEPPQRQGSASTSGWLAKAKSKYRTARGKSKDFGEENMQLNTSPMGQGPGMQQQQQQQQGSHAHVNGAAKESSKSASSKQKQKQSQQAAPDPQAAEKVQASMEPFFKDVSDVKVGPDQETLVTAGILHAGHCRRSTSLSSIMQAPLMLASGTVQLWHRVAWLLMHMCL